MIRYIIDKKISLHRNLYKNMTTSENLTTTHSQYSYLFVAHYSAVQLFTLQLEYNLEMDFPTMICSIHFTSIITIKLKLENSLTQKHSFSGKNKNITNIYNNQFHQHTNENL